MLIKQNLLQRRKWGREKKNYNTRIVEKSKETPLKKIPNNNNIYMTINKISLHQT